MRAQRSLGRSNACQFFGFLQVKFPDSQIYSSNKAVISLHSKGLAALKDNRDFLLTRQPASARESQVATYPTDDQGLLRITGVGEKKLADFGPPMLEAIHRWLSSHLKQEFSNLLPAAAPVRRMKAEGALNGTSLATLERYRAGVTIEEIARERDLSVTTIKGHLANAIIAGEKLDANTFYTPAEEVEMRTAFIGYEGVALKPVFEKLEGRFGYGKLRVFHAFETRRMNSPVVVPGHPG